MGHNESALLMKVELTNRWRVSLTGELDANATQDLYSLAELLRTIGDPVDFDLSQVSFVDRSGWGAVCAAAELLRAAGVAVRIVNPSYSVRRVTELLARTGRTRRQLQGQTTHLAPVA